jgi:hypothetical protein
MGGGALLRGAERLGEPEQFPVEGNCGLDVRHVEVNLRCPEHLAIMA